MPSEGKPQSIDTAVISTPADVPPASLGALTSRRERHAARLAGAVTSWGVPEPGEAVAALALGVAITRRVTEGQPVLIREALRQGSNWDDIGAALGTDAAGASAMYTAWVETLAPEEEAEARRLAG